MQVLLLGKRNRGFRIWSSSQFMSMQYVEILLEGTLASSLITHTLNQILIYYISRWLLTMQVFFVDLSRISWFAAMAYTTFAFQGKLVSSPHIYYVLRIYLKLVRLNFYLVVSFSKFARARAHKCLYLPRSSSIPNNIESLKWTHLATLSLS